jgi:hypothetical protein
MLHEPEVGVADTTTPVGGNCAVSAMPVAVEGPLLATLAV